MLFSTIAKSRLRFIRLATFSFSTRPPQQTSQLNQRILQAKNWKDFSSIFSTNKSEFTQDTFNRHTSGHISGLISQYQGVFNYTEINQIIRFIENLDVSKMSEENVISILKFLRAFLYKGSDLSFFKKLRNKLCTRYIEGINAIPQGKQNVDELLYGYFEMAYFKWKDGCRFISQRLMNRINSEPQNSSFLSLKQATFFLKALALKEVLDRNERRLRSLIMKNLVNEDTLQLQDLVKALVSINKMDFYDGNHLQFSYTKILGNKMIESIADLEIQPVFQFLKGDHNNTHFIFSKIYAELIKNAYEAIKQNGDTLIDRKIQLKLFYFLSSKSSFKKHEQADKKKYYNFLKATAKQFELENDSEGTKLLHSTIQETVKNHYFDPSRNNQLINALLKGNQSVKLGLLEALYYNRIEVKELLTNFLANSIPESLSTAHAIKISTLLKKISTNPQYEAFKSTIQDRLSPITKKIEECFESPQKFTENFLNIFSQTRFNIELRFFHENHFQYFQRLINPFQADQKTTSYQYKLAYLSYIVKTYRNNQFQKFMTTYNQKIEKSLIRKVIQDNMSQDSKKIEPNKLILNLILRNLSSAFQTKQKYFLFVTIQVISKCSRFVVCKDRDQDIAKSIMQIISINIQNVEILKGCELEKYFFSQLSKYISRGSGNYKYEGLFRDLLSQSLKSIDKLPPYLIVEVLRQSLRLNIVEKQAIQNLDFKNLYGLNQSEKESLQYILNINFNPQIKNIGFGNLQYILSNHNLQDLIEKRQSQIIKLIEKANESYLFSYLAFINQPITKVTNRILTKIMNRIVSSEFNIDYPFDLQGALRNLIDKGLYSVKGCKEFAQKIVSLLTIRMSLFSIWTHTEAIKFVISISAYNPKDYYNKLIQYTENNFISQVDSVIYRLSSTNYDFKPRDLKHVRPIIQKSIQRGIQVFLATEKLQSEQERKKNVALIVKRVEKTRAGINALQYDYLKRAYPQQTKDFNLAPQCFQPYKYFSKPGRKVIELLEQIAKVHQTSLQTLADFQYNYIAKINNFCIVFFNKKRTGSFHEHQFLRRLLPLHFQDQNYKITYMGYASITKLAEYIEKQTPQLITPQVKQTVSQFLEKNKAEKLQEHYEQMKLQAEQTQTKQKSETNKEQSLN